MQQLEKQDSLIFFALSVQHPTTLTGVLIAVRIIQSIHPFLIFGADETMLFPSMKRRVVLPARTLQEFTQAKTTLPHFTAMCTHNMYGVSLAPFIILPKLKNLPPELKPFADRGEITFASSSSGLET